MALLSAYVLFTLFPSLCETIFLCIPIDVLLLIILCIYNIK